MEFRQVVHSLCRSTAAATRPSLATTRPPVTASSILLQHHYFSTNNPQQDSAAAVQSRQSSAPSSSDPSKPSPLGRLLQNRSALPPRPKFMRNSNNNTKGGDGQRGPKLTEWMAPAAHRARSNTGTPLTGRAGAPTVDVFGVPLNAQVDADMKKSMAGGLASGGLTSWNANEFIHANWTTSEPDMRLTPMTGRTVQVKGNVDLARALRLLNTAAKRNNVKRDVRFQSFHERPALKRKRQKRERWQARFKAGFRGALERVMQLKAQGW